MCLYNVSINQMGLIMLLDNHLFLEELSSIIQSETNPELQLLALRLLNSVSMQIPTAQVYRDISASVSTHN